MHKMNKIRITGFRRLSEIEIGMRELMVLVGANGVGKSSVLDALSLLSASAAGNLNQTLSDMGGVAEASTHGQDKKITLEAERECQGYKPLKYHLEIEAKGQGYAIPSETLYQDREGDYFEPFKHIESRGLDVTYFDTEAKNIVRPNWDHNAMESSLSQVPKMFEQPEELRRTLSSVTHYHVLDVSPRAPVKLPQQMKPALLPGEDGENLVSFLYNLRENDRDRYEIIEDTLKAAFPGFERLNFPPAAAGMMSLTWKEKQFREAIYSHQLSEGTLRFLWLTAILQSSHRSTITMIDEPEVSLHPELLSLLAELMREAARKSQIIVATHSDRLIHFLEPKEVMVMDMGKEGYSTAQWADSMDIEKWLKEYSFDEVWRMGRIGGRS